MRLDEIKIPESISQTFYVCVCLDSDLESYIGKVTVSTVNKEELYKEDRDDTYKTLTSIDVDIPIPKINLVECKDCLVDSLECQKEKELAEHHMKMTGFQDKIDNLLALEYQPEHGK